MIQSLCLKRKIRYVTLIITHLVEMFISFRRKNKINWVNDALGNPALLWAKETTFVSYIKEAYFLRTKRKSAQKRKKGKNF